MNLSLALRELTVHLMTINAPCALREKNAQIQLLRLRTVPVDIILMSISLNVIFVLLDMLVVRKMDI
jgi:hypothetical protein